MLESRTALARPVAASIHYDVVVRPTADTRGSRDGK